MELAGSGGGGEMMALEVAGTEMSVTTVEAFTLSALRSHASGFVNTPSERVESDGEEGAYRKARGESRSLRRAARATPLTVGELRAGLAYRTRAHRLDSELQRRALARARADVGELVTKAALLPPTPRCDATRRDATRASPRGSAPQSDALHTGRPGWRGRAPEIRLPSCRLWPISSLLNGFHRAHRDLYTFRTITFGASVAGCESYICGQRAADWIRPARRGGTHPPTPSARILAIPRSRPAPTPSPTPTPRSRRMESVLVKSIRGISFDYYNRIEDCRIPKQPLTNEPKGEKMPAPPKKQLRARGNTRARQPASQPRAGGDYEEKEEEEEGGVGSESDEIVADRGEVWWKCRGGDCRERGFRVNARPDNVAVPDD
ncbi:Protein of unknown function [Gryllus bimaculatus]|nr:Protein of unknown function [Gryllus bimaculatus]